jgi:hypothetical protein
MEFDVRIDEALLRRVALRRILRRWPLMLAYAAVIALNVYFELQRGRLGAVSIFGLTAIGFVLVMYCAYYFRQRRNIADWMRSQGNEPVRYLLTAESLRATSKLGSTELRWRAFSELLDHPDFLLLGVRRSGHLTLPRNDVPLDAIEFIRERFSSHGLPTKDA